MNDLDLSRYYYIKAPHSSTGNSPIWNIITKVEKNTNNYSVYPYRTCKFSFRLPDYPLVMSEIICPVDPQIGELLYL